MSKLSQARTLNGDFARSYKYIFSFEVPATSTELGTLITSINAPGNSVKGLSDMMSASCVNCPMPNVGAQEITVEVGQHTMRMPGRHETGGTISPEFILSGDYTLYKFFRRWVGKSSHHKEDIQVSQRKLMSSITIKQLDVEGLITGQVKIENVWARNCPEISYADDSNDIVRFAPELVYEFADEFPAV